MRRWIPLAALILTAGCSSRNADEDNANEAAPAVVATVRTARAELGASSSDITVFGTAEPGPAGARSVVVPAEAQIASIAAPTGSDVRAGQTIIMLRPSPATRAEIARAESDATTAEAAYARARRMRVDGLVSDADVETARAAAATANATRSNLGIRGGAATLRAPIAGTVQNLTARPGDQIAAGTTVATVSAIGDIRARFGVDPGVVGRLHVGQSVQVSLLDGSQNTTVRISGIDPQLDAATRLASIYVQLPPGMRVGAGTPLRASLATGTATTGISVPYAALLDDGGRSYVFVVTGSTARAVNVSPGNSSGDRIQILKGLKPGDLVVVEGGTGLEDGMKVVETGASK